MKNYLSLLAFIAMPSLLTAGEVSLFEESFDEGPGSIAFANFRSPDGEVASFPFGETIGIAESGGIALNPGVLMHFWFGPGNEPVVLDFGGLPVGGVIKTSVDFRIHPDSSGLTVLTVGFSADDKSGTLTRAQSKNVSGSVIRPAESSQFLLRIRMDSEDLETMEFPPEVFDADTWYRLVFELSKASADGIFDYSVSIASIGSNGLSEPVPLTDGNREITLAGSSLQSELLNFSAARWAIDARAASFDRTRNASDGIYALDQFTLTQSVTAP